MKYAAHIRERNGSQEVQTVWEHNLGVARLASQWAAKFNGSEMAYTIGIAHDIGKYSPNFQEYIWSKYDQEEASFWKTAHIETATGKNHAFTGGIPVLQMTKNKRLPYIIAGHHTRLHDMETRFRGLDDWKQYLPVWETIQNEASQELAEIKKPPKRSFQSTTSKELFYRFLYACQIDADWTDTGCFMDDKPIPQTKPLPDTKPLYAYIEAERAKRAGKNTSLQKLRDKVLKLCKDASGANKGMFLLDAPTGSGKTLSSMVFALEHAIKHGMDRVIVVLPFISLIEQTARIFREIFGDENVLEHTSIYTPDESYEAEQQAYEDAASTWNVPIIITTNVQFFESLHSNKPGKVRKIHRVANSVVILDEVQSFPLESYAPTVQMLWDLVDDFGTTVVLASATMPTGIERDGRTVTRIVGDALKEYQRDNRGIRVHWERKLVDLERYVTGIVQEKRHALIVANTRRTTYELAQELSERFDNVLYMTTYLCPAHRSQIVEKIRKEPYIVVATSLVEAGMDFDFPVVVRQLAGLSSINQLAGRCNREGSPDGGDVYVFRGILGDNPRLADSLQRQIQASNVVLGSMRDSYGVDIFDKNIMDLYFQNLYKPDVTDVKGVLQDRQKLNYEKVAKSYRVILDREDVQVVCLGFGAEPIVDEIRQGVEDKHKLRRLLRKLAPHTISLRAAPKIAEEIDLGGDTPLYILPDYAYDTKYGYTGDFKSTNQQ